MAALVGKLLLGATVIAKASAVIITLFDAQMVGQPVCQSDVLLVCSDIAAGQCCYIPGSDFGNALFSGLLEYAVGVVYQDNSEGGGGCAGTATDTGYGDSLCLGPGTGAEWYLVNTKGKREEQANSTHKERPCNAVTPKTLHIGNRKFHIFDNSTVPDKVSEGMLEYFKNSSRNGGSSEVPDPFLLYEIV